MLQEENIDLRTKFQIKRLAEDFSCVFCYSKEVELREFGAGIFQISCLSCGSRIILKINKSPTIIPSQHFTAILKHHFKDSSTLKENEKLIMGLANCGCHHITGMGKKFDKNTFLKWFENHVKNAHVKIFPNIKFEVIELEILSIIKNAPAFTEILTFRASPSLKSLIQENAKKLNLTLTEFLRILVEKAIEKNVLQEEFKPHHHISNKEEAPVA